jgi:hypothetical protein
VKLKLKQRCLFRLGENKKKLECGAGGRTVGRLRLLRQQRKQGRELFWGALAQGRIVAEDGDDGELGQVMHGGGPRRRRRSTRLTVTIDGGGSD